MLLFALLLSLTPQTPEPAAGIDREVARTRAAALANVRYDLSFRIERPVESVYGEVELSFELAGPWPGDVPLVLDFEGEVLGLAKVNSRTLELAVVADHLLVPKSALRAGRNALSLRFRAPVAAAGTPLSVYRDAADGEEYCYTLVVPADAHRLYPCFDQPDLKAVFALRLDLPAEWTAIANGRATPGEVRDGRRAWSFRDTAPLPTYLAAFACGPFASFGTQKLGIPGITAGQDLRVFYRRSQDEHVDRQELLRLHIRGLRWLCDWFGVDYPFDKLDVVLLPGFPYGGMEHAGAIFYRERALAFDHTPTASELARRSTLIYHELSHQWFGNLVTMRWFDDLWLKEGFATFVAYKAMAELEPERLAWLRFLQRVKPRAYDVDATPGTVPVFQELQNLADAKSAYGPIVYNKAPAVLRELEDRLGHGVFQKGVHQFLQAHRFGNATWRDLAHALEQAADADLSRWSDRWLLTASLPRIRVDWSVGADGAIPAARLLQEPVDGAGTWPLTVGLLVIATDGRTERLRVTSDGDAVPIDALVGRRDVVCVLANPEDVAYGQFLPDARSRAWLLEHAANEGDPLLRAVMVSTLFESVREAECDPAAFGALVLDLIEDERDPDTHAWLLGLLSTSVERYVVPARSGALCERATALLRRQLGQGPTGRELAIFRHLARHGVGADVAALCADVAMRRGLPAGLDPGKEDRFLALAGVLARAGDAAGRAAAAELEAALVADLAGRDLGRERFLARAATPTAAAKQEYFDAYLRPDDPPEQWSQDSLPWFHWPGQDDLTLPFLRPALDRVEWVKQHRRIFFMPAWLDAFVNGHSSAEALQVVDTFLSESTLDPDVRRKLLQSRDGLERAVRIRAAFGAEETGR